MSNVIINPHGFGIPYDPSDVTGLVWWIDPDDGSTVTLGTPPEISYIDDKITGTSVTRLQRRSVGTGMDLTTAGGRNWMEGDGATLFMEVANATQAQVNFGTGEFTMFVAFKREFTSTSTRFCIMNKGGTQRYIAIMRQNFDGDGEIFTQIDGSASATLISTTAPISNNTAYTLRMMRDNSASEFSTHINGVAIATAAGSGSVGDIDDATQKLIVGAAPSGASTQFWWDGLIGEILFYDNALAGSDITDIETYLNNKWHP